jgi:hypothetical protein
MTNLIRFPGRRAPPPSPPTSVDVLLGELATVEIEFARARTAQIKSETNQSNVLWFWYCFKKVLFWGCVLWLLTTCAKAQPVGHNGSLMDMRVDNGTGEFSIVYAQPKPSLMAIGVSPGVLLIRGRMNRPSPYQPMVEAIAHVYDPQCGAVPYPVAGRYDATTMILEGPAPVVWAGTCVIAEYVWTANSYLRFDLLTETDPRW